eukprot:2014205-Pleurochrysis_carterae.AAC.1
MHTPAGYARHVQVVSSGRGEAAPKVYADPGPGLDARFRVGFARFYRESTTAENRNGHDSRLYAS